MRFSGINAAHYVLFFGIVIGAIPLVKETYEKITHADIALDYIAILAILVGLVSGEYLAAAVIVLMLSGGNTLEEYGMIKAKQALSLLTSRIPDTVFLYENGKQSSQVKINEVAIGEKIFVRKGEVIPLDGSLVSEAAFVDQSSLTGEPYEVEIRSGALVRSGTVNVGDPMVVEVTKEDKDSTYSKIIELVQSAQQDKSPFIRLADRYSGWFTLVTLGISLATFLFTHDLHRVLAVLVIATPCPLILATPIALMGGVSSAARERIIVKRLSALEVVSKLNALVFDKTGTITLGKPTIESILIHDSTYTEVSVLQIADAIESSSLHPLAKAIVAETIERRLPRKSAQGIKEIVGVGITGVVDETPYTLAKCKDGGGMSVELSSNGQLIASIQFVDQVKEDIDNIFAELGKLGIESRIFTGDKESAVRSLLSKIKTVIPYQAECSPEDKLSGIKTMKAEGKTVGMVGDGINDAPALAQADVGFVFSHQDQTASTEAADIILLGGDLRSVLTSLVLSKKTISIALQSILFGIGLSSLGMVFASLGFIPPIAGAITQEIIDVAVILNALRTSRLTKSRSS